MFVQVLVECITSGGDVNGDGLDDVYLCQPGGLPNRLYVQNSDGDARLFVYHDATDGGPNRLYRSAGLWQFSDVTREVGLDDDNHRHSLAASWDEEVVPGMIAAIQTHSELLHWNPHIHVLITCGAWTPEGDFLELPEFDMERLLLAWQEAVFELYLAATMSTWCPRSSRKSSRTC